MRSTRPASAVALVALAALLAGPVTAASASPAVPDARASARPVEPRDPLVPMVDVRVADFAAEAETLPPQLEQALERDAGLSGAEWLAQAEASAVGVEVVDALRDHIDVRAARLDGLELVVTVGTAAEAAVVESVGARAEIGPAADRQGEADVELLPAANLYGGMPYYFPPGARCSIGFNGIDTGDSNAPVLVTAGHCEGTVGGLREAMIVSAPNVISPPNSAQMTDIGIGGLHVTDQYPDESTELYYDLGFVPITESSWTPRPEVVTWGGGSTGAPLSSSPLVVRDMGDALAGATVCKSGATTGWTCGVISNASSLQIVCQTGTFPCWTDDEDLCGTITGARSYCVGSLTAQICVRGGDSGGPALVGTRAVGITSASTAGSVCTSSDFGVFANLSSSLYERATDLYPDWEPLIGFDSQLTNANPRIPLSTTSLPAQVIGGSSRHSVEASIDGGTPQSATVSANGAWGIDISGVTGTHTYSATASWGSQTQATPSTGEFLRADAVRLFGSNRYQTAIEISQYTFGCGATYPSASTCSTGEVPVVYIANGGNFPDALSAGPAATLEGGPLLLTNGVSIDTDVAAELDRLNPTTIVIVGGTGVVSPGVQTALRAYTQSGTAGSVVRLGGASRYETSRLIAQRLLDQNLVDPGTELWVATGSNYPDALSAGAAAAGAGVPILLVNGTASTLDAATSTFIGSTLDASRVYIAGGTGVVSSGIQSALAALVGGSSNVTRAGGPDRFSTSLLINQLAYPAGGPAVPEALLTYGFNFPDALAGGVLAGTVGAPLYITQTACVSSGIVDHIFDVSPSVITVFGGTAIVSNNARDLKTC
jgi:putative cell wall-binding protein